MLFSLKLANSLLLKSMLGLFLRIKDKVEISDTKPEGVAAKRGAVEARGRLSPA
jgi:hypothetical protein